MQGSHYNIYTDYRNGTPLARAVFRCRQGSKPDGGDGTAPCTRARYDCVLRHTLQRSGMKLPARFVNLYTQQWVVL